MLIFNPPFSLQNWGAEGWANDPHGRVICGVPPAKNGDYAWIQHMVASMKQDTGRVGVVMPHGVLFRGGKEGAIPYTGTRTITAVTVGGKWKISQIQFH